MIHPRWDPFRPKKPLKYLRRDAPICRQVIGHMFGHCHLSSNLLDIELERTSKLLR